MQMKQPMKASFSRYDLDTVVNILNTSSLVSNGRGVRMINAAVSFDIETTSYKENEIKYAWCYEWSFAIGEMAFYGRKLEDFIAFINSVSTRLNLYKNNRLIIYVHNLGFEFQFIRKYFEWEEVFSNDVRKPIYALTKNGIEFRCSYFLSGYSLANLAKNLEDKSLIKMVGDLDYKLIRTPETPLNEKELGYCSNDVLIVTSYINEQIRYCGNISKIPLTKTGFVRNHCRNKCLHSSKSHKKIDNKYRRYRMLMNDLTLDVDEYNQLKQAFQGGFTHCSAVYSGETIEDVSSFDFVSSYPAVMICEKFPMGHSKKVKVNNKEYFEYLLKNYCCLFNIAFTNIKSLIINEHIISYSKCVKSKNVIVDNGRVVSADYIVITLTEQDYISISKFYAWDKKEIGTFRIYKKDYLPTDFIESILDLYVSKTTLKGIKGEEVNYLKSKEMLNSCYGMCVTDIVRENVVYDDEWKTEIENPQKSISKYNKSVKRFLSYPWGVWVTAYARKNLFTGIIECGNDYVYSDTDSIKIKNKDNHLDYINRYNEMCNKKLNAVIKRLDLDSGKVFPANKNGDVRVLGSWDYEGDYDKFKSLGAKRYMTIKDDELSITVSGLNKSTTVDYLKSCYTDIDSILESFDDGLYIPKENTGKNTHTYLDDEIDITVTDYLGQTSKVSSKSSIHLEEADYTLSLSKAYIDYLKGKREDFE